MFCMLTPPFSPNKNANVTDPGDLRGRLLGGGGGAAGEGGGAEGRRSGGDPDPARALQVGFGCVRAPRVCRTKSVYLVCTAVFGGDGTNRGTNGQTAALADELLHCPVQVADSRPRRDMSVPCVLWFIARTLGTSLFTFADLLCFCWPRRCSIRGPWGTVLLYVC